MKTKKRSQFSNKKKNSFLFTNKKSGDVFSFLVLTTTTLWNKLSTKIIKKKSSLLLLLFRAVGALRCGTNAAVQELRAGAQVLNRSLKETKYYSSFFLLWRRVYLSSFLCLFLSIIRRREGPSFFFHAQLHLTHLCAEGHLFFFFPRSPKCLHLRPSSISSGRKWGGRIYIFLKEGYFKQKVILIRGRWRHRRWRKIHLCGAN